MNIEIEQLIEDNKKLVFSIANSLYRNNRVFSKEDLIQVGFLALCKSGHKYDEARGKISTFITHCVRNDMLKFMKSNKINSPISLDVTSFDCQARPDASILEASDYVALMSEMEKTIVRMKQEGESNKNISLKLKVTQNKISKVLSIIRRRIEKQNA